MIAHDEFLFNHAFNKRILNVDFVDVAGLL